MDVLSHPNIKAMLSAAGGYAGIHPVRKVPLEQLREIVRGLHAYLDLTLEERETLYQEPRFSRSIGNFSDYFMTQAIVMKDEQWLRLAFTCMIAGPLPQDFRDCADMVYDFTYAARLMGITDPEKIVGWANQAAHASTVLASGDGIGFVTARVRLDLNDAGFKPRFEKYDQHDGYTYRQLLLLSRTPRFFRHFLRFGLIDPREEKGKARQIDAQFRSGHGEAPSA